VGRKDVPGRPIMYGTTKFFLEHFGLQDLSQLPPLREFKELGESEQSLLPIEDESPEVVETSEPTYSGELPLTNDLAEGEVPVAFEAESNGELINEPVEQS
ncbi:MAG: SMC-Scp complex subunit ScpB, partial [Nitrospirota bacterium]